MYRTIIVGYDGTDQADDGLAFAIRLAKVTGARLTLAFAYGGNSIPLGIGSASIGVAMRKEAQVVLNRGLKRVPPEVQAGSCPLREASASRALHELAESKGADLVVLGSAQHGPVGRVVSGTVAIPLLHGLSCGVAVVPQGFRHDAREGLTKIGLCWDESPEAELALEAGVELARLSSAELMLLHAVDPTGNLYAAYPGIYVPDEREISSAAEESLAAVLDRLPEKLVASADVLIGRPAVALSRRAAEERLDMLVTGSRGYGPVRRVLLGGVSSKLMRNSPCPVLIVPRSASERYRHTEDEATITGAGALR